MLGTNKIKTHGDTLIEVLFAITIFSSVMIGGLTIMNSGVSVAQEALEITLVRQAIDAQAETLRFLNTSYVGYYQPSNNTASYAGTPATEWLKVHNVVFDNPSTSVSALGTCTPPAKSFILNTRDATVVTQVGITGTTTKVVAGLFQPAQSFSQVKYDASSPGQVTEASGIWIEAVKPNFANFDTSQKDTGYIDFNIRACWTGVGQSRPTTIGTIVRLYEPLATPALTPAPPFVPPAATPITAIGPILGIATVGQTLTAGTITPAGATVTYQWQSSTTSGGTYTNIAGATNSTYTLTSSDLNKYLRVVVNGYSSSTGSVTSSVTTIVKAKLFISAGANGTVNTAVNGDYVVGSTPTITATPNIGYAFSGWSGDTGCSGTASHSINMDSNKSCTATFSYIDPNWISGVSGTAMEGKFVYNSDAPSSYSWYSGTPIFTVGCPVGGRWPTITELQSIYNNRSSYGGTASFKTDVYWSSTEVDAWYAYNLDFDDGGGFNKSKGIAHFVRCVSDNP